MRFLIFTALFLMLLFVALIGVVRAQPFESVPIYSMIDTPTDCENPCWQGIEIGTMSRDEALSILNSHAWVKGVRANEFQISWRWSGAQPALIDPDSFGLIRLDGAGNVGQLRVQTRIPYGDIWLAFSSPENALLIRPVSRTTAYQISIYESRGIQVISTLSCPAYPADLWNSMTTIGMGDIWLTEALNGFPFDVYNEPGWWRHLHICRPPRGR
jgi:hypothetical protein